VNPFDVITMGRVGVDLYPAQVGVRLSEVTQFDRYLGGTATNVAVAAARYGHRSAVITKVGDDEFGVYVRGALDGFGVDPGFVGTHPTLRTPIVFCEVHPPDHFPLLFYREPTAPDMTLATDDLDFEAIASALIFWTTGTGLSDEPSRGATLAAQDAAGGMVIHDLDYRAMFWSSPEEAGGYQRQALSRARVAVGNIGECAVAVGAGEADEMARRILELGPEVAVVKQGPRGVSAFTADDEFTAPPLAVEVVNGLGAGDAFGGALCHGLLVGWGWDAILPFANAAGAYVAARMACADAMPDESAVMELMAHV
jgi:5-dehydro-2-deoxygluconokinase